LRSATRQWVDTAALTLMLVAIWSLTQDYLGFSGDAKLYAVQALSRLQPALNHDIFLQNSSQDQFTLFSPLFAWFIEWFGLPSAEMALTITFKVWFLAAAWCLARRFFDSHSAFLAVAALIVLPAGYGAVHVFQYSENWLTARSLAEPLVITSLALYAGGLRLLSALCVLAAFCVHPLMALPGALVLACLRVSGKTALLGAGLGLAICLTIAIAGVFTSHPPPILTVMDAAWLTVARERSQFLFLQLWTANDWMLNLRPFLSLTFTAFAVDDARVRKLCVAVMLVGAAGMAVALVASFVGPIAILVQGQAWRWIWLACFTSVLLLLPTAMRVWRDERCGTLCALLLIGSWLVTPAGGVVSIVVALLLWLLRTRMPHGIPPILRWSAALICLIAACWTLSSCWTVVLAAHEVSPPTLHTIGTVRKLAGLQVVPLCLVLALTNWIGRTRNVAASWGLLLALLAASLITLPTAFGSAPKDTAAKATDEFSDWRNAIPADSNVLVVPSPVSASFAWFVLERPSYLSTDQSAGVIFSRQTALEIRRRSEIVQPLWDNVWRLRSRATVNSTPTVTSEPLRPLTAEILISLCRDPLLGFVVAKQHVGFDPARHTQTGSWKDWSLYDCRRVNSWAPTA
jgi:hypothetical protein